MRPWNWLPSVQIPVVLAVVEATWVSLALSAIVNGSGRFRMDLPFLAFAVPAAVAACLVGLSGRPRWPRWQRALVLAPLLLVGVALTAGLVSALSVPGSFGAVALHPWSVVGRIPSETAALAWFVAVLTWGRGTWLGARTITFTHAAWSATVSLLGFLVLFAVLAGDHHTSLHVATPLAPALFIVFFAGAISVLALVRERDMEIGAQGRPSSRPSAVWLSVLAVPMLGVAAIALAIALLGGPVAPIVGRGVERAALAIGAALLAVARAIADVFPRDHGHPKAAAVTVRGATAGAARPVPAAHPAVSAHVPTLAWEIVALAAAAGGVVLLVRWLVPRMGRRHATPSTPDEERDSVFSWGHLRDQLLALLRSCFPRRRRRSAGVEVAEEPVVGVAGPEPAGIRAQYRRFLIAALDGEVGKAPSETTGELQHRLARVVVPEGTVDDLDRVTALYDRARYGGDPGTAGDREIARRGVDELIEAVRRHARDRMGP